MRILLATDGSDEANTVVEFMNQFTFPPHSEVSLFHVIEPTDYTVVQDDYKILGVGPSGLQKIQQLAKEIHRNRERAQTSLLQKTKQSLASRKVKVEKIAIGYAAEEIIKAASRFRADLIVMGSRGLSGVKRTVLGSVSNRVVCHAPCSVLVVRPIQTRSSLRI
jgi:nucleotide-binding universal stress UspA family protein